jgi:dTMP kinase
MSRRYIALEGAEGAGKTTVAAAVVRLLEGRGERVVAVREPGGTRLGEEIRALLLHAGDMAPWTEAALFAAQRAQLAAEVVAPALAAGSWVVADRSYYSSLAYQGGARGLGIEAVRTLNETVLAGVVPDLVAVLDVDPAAGLARQVGEDRIGGSGLAFQEAVVAAYHRLARDEPSRVVLVPGGRPAVEVAEAVLVAAGGAR